MLRLIVILFAAIAIFAGGYWLLRDDSAEDITVNTSLLNLQTDLAGFARAVELYDWNFPADHAAHPQFQTEWWYYTGNLQDEDGRHFGFQFTVFRRAITPDINLTDSEWRSNQYYMAHFTISDIAEERFLHDQIFSRSGADLAGAVYDGEDLRLWVENWEVRSTDAAVTEFVLQAESIFGFGVDLSLSQAGEPALQGANTDGLSAKGQNAGEASYYYSLPRLITEGEITIEGETFSVSGNSWMDHEFSSGALTENTQGWDWFGLQFEDGREMMIGHVRLGDGSLEPAFGGLLINADGTTQYLPSDSFEISATAEWTSPHSGATYPAGWDIRVDIGEAAPLAFSVTPLMADQELTDGIIYWEGAVEISGDVSGFGYAELTGYAESMNGRF